MHRASLQQRLQAREEARIELSPLIDIVFILLIFFIVSTVFVKEAGIEVDKPSAISAQQLEKNILIIAISSDGQVYHAGTNIGLAGVRPTLSALLIDQDQPVVIQADASITADLLVQVVDQVKLAGASAVHIATSRES